MTLRVNGTDAGAGGGGGTDLSTLLTTNGDLVVRDSGAPARLGVGTAKQVLRSNASGNGVEYAAPAEVVGGGLATLLSEEVAGTALVADGAGDVTATSAAVSALLASSTAAEARTAIGASAAPTELSTLTGAITLGGLSHQLLVTLTVKDLSAVARVRAPLEVWLFYTQDINSLGLNSGTQVERILGDYGSGVAGSTRYYATTNASGVVQISAGWSASGGTLYVEARVRGVPSAVYLDSRAIP